MAELVVITQQRYRCPHCRRSWAKRTAAVRHAAVCQRNTAIRGCRTCAHYCRAIIPRACFGVLDPGEPHGCAVGHPGFAEADGRVVGCDKWVDADG